MFCCRLLAEKETPVEKQLQSLSLRGEVTPPSTPTKRGAFSFMSPTKVRRTFDFLTFCSILRICLFLSFKELPPPPFPTRRAAEFPDDDILFDLDADYLDPNTPNADPFDAPELENGGNVLSANCVISLLRDGRHIL